jgi:TonB family protein
MSDTFARAHDHFPVSDRRAHARQAIPSLAYVELDEGNGGILLNISEGGLSVQAVTSLMDDFLPGVRFQLAGTESWIETNARITWTNETRKLAGLEFLNLTEDSRDRIREWLLRDSPEAKSATEIAPVDSDADKTTTAEMEAVEVATVPNSVPPAAPGPTTESEPSRSGSGKPATMGSAVTADVTPAVAPSLPPEAPQGVSPAFPAMAPSGPEVAAVSAALADLMTSVSDRAHAPLPHPPPAAPIPFRPVVDAKSSDAKPAKSNFAEAEGLIGDRWSAAVVLMALAVGSLAAGWVAGQGHLRTVIAKLHGGAQEGAEQIRGALQHLGLPAAKPAEIEVENASGQRWSIPFNGPMNPPNASNRHTGSGNGSGTDAQKAPPSFRTWILTPPQQSRATTDDASVKEAPPVVPETYNSNENVLTGPGAHALAPAPVLAVPAPPTPTGVVKQGQLIRRVDPTYPVIAKEQHSEGTVRLNVTIGTDGVVRGVSLLGGPRLLIDAAERAVRQWRYTPTLLDGKPIEFQREVDLTFRLTPATR